MHKKVMVMVSVIVVVAVVLSAAFFLRPKEPIQGEKIEETTELELVGLIESEDAAKEIAEGYDIELIRYTEGVAVFRTDKTYEEILEIGKEKGLTELSLNIKNRAF